MDRPAPATVTWRAPASTPRWRVGPLRPAVEATVTAPDGRRFVVRVTRALWPGYTRHSGVHRDIVKDGPTDAVPGGVLDLLTSRFVWRVRVFGARSRLGMRPLIRGEEWLGRDECVDRAHELAEELAGTWTSSTP